MNAQRRLKIYTRENCGLCERMRGQVEACIATANATLVMVDIEGDHDLEERFGSRVPVLFVDGKELCHGRLDADLLEEALAGTR